MMRGIDYLGALIVAAAAHLGLLGIAFYERAGMSETESTGSFEAPLVFEISLDEGAGAPPAARPIPNPADNTIQKSADRSGNASDKTPIRRDETETAETNPVEQIRNPSTPDKTAGTAGDSPFDPVTSMVQKRAVLTKPNQEPIDKPSQISADEEKLSKVTPQEKPPMPQRRPTAPVNRESSSAVAKTNTQKRQPSGTPGQGLAKRQTGAPSTGAIKSYATALRRWVARHKQYPNEARRKQLQGAVRLWIKIDQNGTVVASQLTKQSGVALLDQATADLPRRASPFPRIPAQVNKTSFSFSVTLRYTLR